MDNFDLKKYLVENKVTTNSKMMNENEEVPFSDNNLKKVVVAGITYEVGSDDPNDEGTIIAIEKHPKGYFIMGQSGREGYGYGVDFEGNQVDQEEVMENKATTNSKMIKEKISNLEELTKEMGSKFKVGDNLTTYGGGEEVTIVSVQPNLAAALADTKNPKAVEALKQDIRQGFVDKEDENKPFYLVTSEAFPIDKYYVESELESE